MAGSLNHLIADDGTFKMGLIENLGDAHEALEECFEIIKKLSGGKAATLNPILRELRFPEIDRDMA